MKAIHIVNHGNELRMEIRALSRQFKNYGCYYVSVYNKLGQEAWLHKDLNVRGVLRHIDDTRTPFYHTVDEAHNTILEFAKHHGDKPMSIDNILRGSIDTAINDFVTNQKMFTALDVTNAVRNSALGLHVFHSVVKGYVHDVFDRATGPLRAAGYERQLATFGNPPPWVYYIPGVHSPSAYNPTLATLPVVVPTPTPPQPTTASTGFIPHSKRAGQPPVKAGKPVQGAFVGITNR